MEKEVEAAYDIVWESIFLTQEWGKYPGESLIRFIAKNFYSKDRPNISLLEIGCGPGANVWYMTREGFNVTGIDGSETAIKIANNRLVRESLTARLIVGDIISLPFNKSEFDGVIDVECLFCINEEKTLLVLEEIKRVLKTGGLFYSRTFSKAMKPKNAYKINKFEFSNISTGPFAANGFARLIDEPEIKRIYGRFFNILSIDKMEYTRDNGDSLISEYNIVCQKI